MLLYHNYMYKCYNIWIYIIFYSDGSPGNEFRLEPFEDKGEYCLIYFFAIAKGEISLLLESLKSQQFSHDQDQA